MSEQQRPKHHPLITEDGDDVFLRSMGLAVQTLKPDQAVALGYALFEHGLYLKGRINQPPKE